MAAPDSPAAARTAPPWVAPLLARFRGVYRRPDGLLQIAVGPDGASVRDVPLIADFGDVLPFLDALGAHDIVDEQLRLAEPHLWRGLYRRDGRVRLFLNHDWLLGLFELGRTRPAALRMARQASRALRDTFVRDGFLIDERPADVARAQLWPASPFNGGFAELWVEEHHLTGEAAPLRAAVALGEAWIGTELFREHGLFGPQRSLRSPLVSRALARRSSLGARLFKDNTNLVWGLLALAEATGDDRWRAACERWLSGFVRRFLHRGVPVSTVDRRLEPGPATLKAAFASVDLLVDLDRAGVGEGRAREVAEEIAQAWIALQWPNGLFPETPSADRDHLDANVDMAVALVRLAAGSPNLADALVAASMRCREAILAHHPVSAGLALAVGRDGELVDGTVLVKYQALATKLALLPDDPAELDAETDRLLRDR